MKSNELGRADNLFDLSFIRDIMGPEENRGTNKNTTEPIKEPEYDSSYQKDPLCFRKDEIDLMAV